MKFNRLTLTALATAAILTACGGGGGSDNNSGGNPGGGNGGEGPVVPVVPTNPGTIGSDLKVFCSGANCGAVNETTYAGTGVGVWEHENTTQQPKNINVNLNGIQGKTVYAALVNISPESVNISSNNLTTFLETQELNTLSKREMNSHNHDHFVAATGEEKKAQDFHMKLQDFSNQSIQMLKAADPATKQGPAMRVAQAAPANQLMIGENQIFNFYNGLTGNYENQSFRLVKTTVANDNRAIQYWVQGSEWNSSKIVASDVDFLNTKFLKTYAENKRLNGEPYGPAAENYSNLIPSSNQPINIVLGNITPNDKGFGVVGYFYSLNNFLKSTQPTSNEALQVFVDTENIYRLNGTVEAEGTAGREEGLDLAASALIHEFSHMISYYERNLVKGVEDSKFVAESLALSTEFLLQELAGFKTDIFATRTWPFMIQNTTNKCGIFSWNQCDNSYERTSALMAFMASKHGPRFHESYARDTTSANMYYMFNNRISGFGQSFTDEVKRFAMLPAGVNVEMPVGFGFAGLDTDGVKIKKYNGVLTTSGESMTRTNTLPDFGASYFVKSSISGNNLQKTVVVPAGTALVVMVK